MAFTQSLKIISHHVGARAFGVAFNAPDEFASEVFHVTYEADLDCFAEMQETMERDKDRFKNMVVLPHCLGKERCPAKLNICRNAFFSSLYAPNDYYGQYSCELQYLLSVDKPSQPSVDIYDVLYGYDMEVVKTIDVDVLPLDYLFESKKIASELAPDILSLDTQGSELDILFGAKELVLPRTLAVVTEIEFLRLYANQPLFSDILDFMEKSGFHFAGFTHLQEISPHRVPIGLRGRGFTAFGDGLFIRRIETLADIYPNPEDRHLAAMKLAFTALTFGYTDYSFAALEYAGKNAIDSVTEADFSKLGYYRFLRELQNIAVSKAGYTPPYQKLERRAPIDGSQPIARSQTLKAFFTRHFYERPLKKNKRLRQLVLSDPLDAFLLAVGYFFIHLHLWIFSRFPVASASVTPMSLEESAVEQYLRKHGFGLIADQLAARRFGSERILRLNGAI